MEKKTKEDILKSDLSPEEKEIELQILEDSKKRGFISTTKARPPKKKETFISTHDLNSEGKSIEQRYWDRQKIEKKPAITTSDVALSESEEEKIRRDGIMAEIKKEKEKK